MIKLNTIIHIERRAFIFFDKNKKSSSGNIMINIHNVIKPFCSYAGI